MGETQAVYAGSFDPLTYGHMNIIERSLRIFDKIIVAVAINYQKQALFTPEERVEMIREIYKNEPRVEVESFEGLLVEYMKRKGVKIIIRGLRATSDFEYEYHMASMNKSLYPEADTIFMVTAKDYFFISSRTIKEIASLGGKVDDFVPPIVALKLKEKFSKL